MLADMSSLGASRIDEFEPAFILYRAALVQVRAAEKASRARIAARRQQEADAAASAMILVQAALEGWIKAACLRSGITTRRRKWLDLWANEPFRIAECLDRPVNEAEHPMPDIRYLLMVNDFRNYLVHGDENARKKAGQHLNGSPSVVLAYYPALLAQQSADELFAHGMSVTGYLAPTKQRLLDLQPDLLR